MFKEKPSPSRSPLAVHSERTVERRPVSAILAFSPYQDHIYFTMSQLMKITIYMYWSCIKTHYKIKLWIGIYTGALKWKKCAVMHTRTVLGISAMNTPIKIARDLYCILWLDEKKNRVPPRLRQQLAKYSS